MKKQTTYVLMISEYFPAYHPQAGKPTHFEEKIRYALTGEEYDDYGAKKFHTIRENPELWMKRIAKVNAGEAVLSVRKWSGKPYRSKQHELFLFDKDSGLGVQKLINSLSVWLLGEPDSDECNKVIKINDLSINDGLSEHDFRYMLADYDMKTPKAVIWFTSKRY